MDVDESSQSSPSTEDVGASSQNSSLSEEASPVTLVVMDGVVMGPTHCAFDDCIEELQNAQGFFFVHDMKLHMVICVACVIATDQNLLLATPVQFTKIIGISIP